MHIGEIIRSTYHRHRLLAAGIIVLVLLSPFVVRRFFSRAEVADFYPATCLGSWENPHYAEGKPETFDSSDVLITRENASMFAGVNDKIFCGNFIPNDYEPKGEIARVGLTLVWSINENTSFPAPSPDVAPAASSSEPETAPEEEVPASDAPEKPKLDESKIQNQEPAPPPPQEPALPVDEPSPAPSSTSLFENFIFSSLFFAQANAQTPENQTTTEEIISPSVENIIIEETPSSTVPTEVAEEAQPIPAPAESLPENSGGGEVILSPVVAAPEPDSRFLKISYSVDGESWSEIAKVSSADLHNFTVALPVSNWEELKKIQISIEGIPTSESEVSKIFLDGMLVEIEYAVPPIFQGEEAVVPAEENTPTPPVVTLLEHQRPFPAESQSSDFGSNETPLFQMNLDDLPLSVVTSTPVTTSTPPTTLSPPPPAAMSSSLHREGFFFSLGRAFLSFFGARHSAHAEAVPSGLPNLQNPVVAKIIGPDGKDTNFEPSFLTINNQLRISVPEPQKPFIPGRYRLELFIFKNNTVYFTENNFTWGVLAVNFDKSVYTKGDTAHIGLAVLTDQGHTLCDAELTLNIVFPSGERTRLSTQNGKVKRNPSCGPETITNEPDYSSEIKANEVGEYAVTVVAETANGTRQITDKFRVEAAPLFDVLREGPTRIFPPATYKVSLRVTAAEDFTGDIMEHVPESFEVINETNSRIDVQDGIKNITWRSATLKKGEEREFVYFFKAPDISPELYKLGPFEIGLWRESRKWQVAADAAGDVILLWDGNNIPSGWTCISCAATDPFFNVFPRASSTYGSASTSADTAYHNFTGASDGGAMTTANNMGNGAVRVVQTDTHTWGNGTSTSDSILPSYKGLKLITASSPVTQLPNGAIGIFDVAATSSLPGNWSYYSAMDGNYLRGANTTSTGGSATHSHTVLSTITSGNSSAGGGSGTKSDAVASAHTHSISTSATTTVDNNAPSFRPVVFAQLSTTSTIPDGLIAMFDNTSLPTDWNIISTSGSAYAGNLLKGANALGSAGGATTHNHGGTRTWISSAGGTLTAGTGTNGGTANAAGSHTHSVTYTVTEGNSMPVYRDVILGKYTAPVANSAPTVSAVVLNGGSAITLNENTTKAITVVASTTDPEGVGDISFATGTLYRSGIAGTKNCTADNLNCYQIASSGCSFTDTTSTVSCSANIWHFAQATDASSSFSAQNWLGSITVTDSASNNTNSTTASGVELNTLLAIDVTPATTNYGTLAPGTSTGSTNATTSVKNSGNSSSTLTLHGTALTLLSNSIATSSQHYATSSFTFGGNEQALSEASTSVSGFLLTSPTSTTAVSTLMYWGITIPTGKATGTYSGTNVYTGVFAP